MDGSGVGGGRLQMKAWTQKKWIKLLHEAGGGGLHGVLFLGLLDNSEVEEEKKKWENGDVVRRRREEEPEWGINRPWGSEAAQLKNNGIQVFEDNSCFD